MRNIFPVTYSALTCKQSHEKVFCHEETGLENKSSAPGVDGDGREELLESNHADFNLFSIKVRSFSFFGGYRLG